MGFLEKQTRNKRLVLSGFGLFLLLFLVPLSGIPPFRFGYYVQVEPVICAFWFTGGLCGLWSLIFNYHRPYLAKKIWQIPLVWGWIPIILMSAILSVFHPLPLQYWTGSGQLAEGILTFTSAMFMSFLLVFLIKTRKFRKYVFFVFLISGALLSGLTILGSFESPILSYRNWFWAPLFFPDYIAFFVVSLVALYWIYRKEFKDNLFYHLILLSCIAFFGYYASNKSLGYGFFISFTALIALELPLFKKLLYQTKLYIFYCVSTLSLTFVILLYDKISPFLPSTLSNLLTLQSRTYLTKVAIIDFFYKTFNFSFLFELFLGKGWGKYPDALIANVFLLKEVSLYSGKDWNPNWEFVTRDLLHSHNFIIETFLSVGLLGLLLYFVIQYFIVASLRKDLKRIGAFFFLSLAILLTFWFQMFLTIPYVLLIMAFLFSKPSSTFPQLKFSWIQKGSMMMVPLLLIWSLIHGVMVYQVSKRFFAKDTHDLPRAISSFLSPSFVSAYETAIGARRRVAIGRLYSKDIIARLHKQKTASTSEMFETSLQIAKKLHTTINPEGNYYSLIATMSIFSELAVSEKTKLIFAANEENLKEWTEVAQKFIHVMPFRSDILMTYFHFLAQHHHDEELVRFCKAILTLKPSDPIALWFLGASLLQSGSHFDDGICLLKKALKNNLTHYMPIPPQKVKEIEEISVLCPKENLKF
jgi:hypothetical protein